MSEKLRAYIRDHHLSLLCLFLIVSGGTAYATHPGGANTISSVDIINGEVMTPDIGSAEVTVGKLATDSVNSAKVVDASLTGADVALDGIGAFDISDNAFRSEDIRAQFIGFGKAYAIPPNAIQSDEVTNNSLQGADIDEATLTALDGHDSFDTGCDPSTLSFITCDELTFTLGRPMQVLTLFNYGFGSGSDLDPKGDCRTTLDGVVTSSIIRMLARDQAFSRLGGIPVLDVISLGAGTHTIGLQCREEPPADSDIEIHDIRLAAVELGMD